MNARRLSPLLAVLIVLGATSLPAGASAPNPYAQMRLVIADANRQQSVRVTTTAQMSGMKIVEITDAGHSEGRQTITLTSNGKSNTIIGELIAGRLFVKGDAAILTSYLAFSQTEANEYAGQWFGIPRGNTYYAEIAQGLTLSTGMAEVTMTSGVRSARETSINGRKVEVLVGNSVKSSLEASFKESMYFTVSASPLPVEVTQTVQGSLGTITFSRWNEKIDLVAPKIKLHLE
jgi:aspartate 1-decarboxylase